MNLLLIVFDVMTYMMIGRSLKEMKDFPASFKKTNIIMFTIIYTAVLRTFLHQASFFYEFGMSMIVFFIFLIIGKINVKRP